MTILGTFLLLFFSGLKSLDLERALCPDCLSVAQKRQIGGNVHCFACNAEAGAAES